MKARHGRNNRRTQGVEGGLGRVRRVGPAFATLSAIGSFVGDVLRPLAPILLYTAITALLLALALTAVRKRLPPTGANAVLFLWIWTVTSGLFVVGEWSLVSGSRGLTADLFPAAAALQSRLGLLQSRLDEVHVQTTRIDDATSRIESSVSDLGDGIRALGQLGGVIVNPETPEQWYSNARVYELRGDFGNARRAYLQCLPQLPDKVDAHLDFVQFLKIQEGRVGAREAYLPVARRSPGVGTKVALATLLPPVKQAEELASIEVDGIIPAPVLFLLADRYSEERLGAQSLADKRLELKWLELFAEAKEEGPYLVYFADQSTAGKWLEAAASRLAALMATTSLETLQNPVQVGVGVSNNSIIVRLSLAEQATDISWRDSPDDGFKSTGLTEYIDRDTGRRRPNSVLMLPLQDGDVHLEVQYTTTGGQVMGPYDVSFNALDAGRAATKEQLERFALNWIAFREYPEGRGLVYFSTIVSNRLAIRSVRYMVDGDESWSAFPITMGTSLREAHSVRPGDRIYIECPVNVQRIRVQLEYYDGEWSEVREYANLRAAGG